MNAALFYYNYRGTRRNGLSCSLSDRSRFSLTFHQNEFGTVDCSHRTSSWNSYINKNRCSSSNRVALLDGMQGQTFLDAGFTYAPYEPQYHPPEFDPSEFTLPASIDLADDFQDMMGYVTSGEILP